MLALPQASVAVQVRVTEYDAPQLGVVTSDDVSVTAEPQASAAVGVANTGVPGHAIVLEAGKAEITGAVTSRT